MGQCGMDTKLLLDSMPVQRTVSYFHLRVVAPNAIVLHYIGNGPPSSLESYISTSRQVKALLH